MDENQFEIAEENERRTIELAIKTARDNLKQMLLPTGMCYNCQEPLKGQKLFCDLDCEHDYTLRLKRKIQNT
jgi:hypothetical protein